MSLSQNTSHHNTVKKFLRKYETAEVPARYLESLKASVVREESVMAIHLNPDNESGNREMWKSLKPQLSPEDIQKYESLMQFGKDKTEVRLKSKLRR